MEKRFRFIISVFFLLQISNVLFGTGMTSIAGIREGIVDKKQSVKVKLPWKHMQDGYSLSKAIKKAKKDARDLSVEYGNTELDIEVECTIVDGRGNLLGELICGLGEFSRLHIRICRKKGLLIDIHISKDKDGRFVFSIVPKFGLTGKKAMNELRDFIEKYIKTVCLFLDVEESDCKIIMNFADIKEDKKNSKYFSSLVNNIKLYGLRYSGIKEKYTLEGFLNCVWKKRNEIEALDISGTSLLGDRDLAKFELPRLKTLNFDRCENIMASGLKKMNVPLLERISLNRCPHKSIYEGGFDWICPTLKEISYLGPKEMRKTEKMFLLKQIKSLETEKGIKQSIIIGLS